MEVDDFVGFSDFGGKKGIDEASIYWETITGEGSHGVTKCTIFKCYPLKLL